MKKMTDKKFEEWPFQVPNFANVGARLKGFAELFAKASSPEEALKIWKKCTRLIESVEDKITHVSVLFSLETTNKKYEKAMKKINNAMPLLELETQKLSKAYLESPYLEFLEGKLGKLLTKMYQYELKKSDESVVALKQEESELVMKYQAATAALSFEFRGEKYNMPQMGKFLQDTDRETRKEAAEVYYSGLNAAKDELEDIFDKLVKVRTEMAKKMGYKSYTELGYIMMNRYDYNPMMVAAYREQIKEVVTPLAAKIVRKQIARLGIRNPEIYDLNLMFPNGNPTPKGTTEDKVNAAVKMYDQMSPDTSKYFRYMKDHNLLFLDAKPGKQSGGYMTYFPIQRTPIIFSNFNGTSGDVDVLTHEFGHSFQAFESADIKIPAYRSPTAESCEIHSMSMEFFAEPYMDLFFDEPDKYRYAHLASSICFLPYGVSVDEFQHWVYAHPEATPAERDEQWHRIEEKYTPWKVEAERNCEYLYTGHRWLTQIHIFELPFYYIDYTLAQVCAFQFFNKDRRSHDNAWKKYMKLCKLGGKFTFCELVKKVGLEVPFDEGVLAKTVKPLEKVLRDYHPENF